MRKPILFIVSATLVISAGTGPTMAQGRGNRGANVPPPAAGPRAATGPRDSLPAATGRGRSELGRTGVQRHQEPGRPSVSQGSSRRSAGSPFASGLNHASRGSQPGLRGAEGSADAGQDRGLGNAERIRDKQFSQAEHLRRVSEANGNERLLETADRMESGAQTRYERRVGSATNNPVIDPSDEPLVNPEVNPVVDPGLDPASEPAAAPSSTTVAPNAEAAPTAAATTAAPEPRNSWIPSWFRGRSSSASKR